MLRKLSSLFSRRDTRTAFQFSPRWKEEVLVSGVGGSFVLDLTMGVMTAYLPNEENWKQNGPVWARELWPVLRDELEDWCRANNAQLIIDDERYITQEE